MKEVGLPLQFGRSTPVKASTFEAAAHFLGRHLPTSSRGRTLACLIAQRLLNLPGQAAS